MYESHYDSKGDNIMMRNPEQTIGNLISKCGLCAVASIDSDGFPNIKEMYAPAERLTIKSQV